MDPPMSILSRSMGYTALSATESDAESNLKELPQRPRRRLPVVLQVVGAVVALSVYSVLLLYFNPLSPACYTGAPAALTRFKGAQLKTLPDAYDQIIYFNGSLDFPSIYRGGPSDEVDNAWNQSINLGAVKGPFNDDDIWSLGVDPTTAVKMPDHRGGGYQLHFEFQHQMHCVNLLRMTTYYEYYKDKQPEFVDTQQTQRVHIDHCIEMLRQFVMCHSDTNLITAHWVEGRDRPYPNFSTRHVCRNYDAIMDWAMHHQVPVGRIDKPVGAKELPETP